MVKQHLWIANSTLVGVLLLSFGAHLLLRQSVPSFKKRRRRNRSTETVQQAPVVNVEKIYHNDIFGTFVPTPEKGPQAKNLVTPIPRLDMPAASPPPPAPKAEFVPPLNITIKGIILSPDQAKSIAMVVDQTGKESVYHVGDKIHDGQIIKLTKNKLVLLRNTGQQETFFLRKPDEIKPGLSSWDYAIKKIDDALYHLDPVEITKEITSIGEVIEALDLGGSYENNISKGLQVGILTHHPLGKKLGLEQGDIIVSVNDIAAETPKQRIQIYDALAALPMGGHIHLKITRNGSEKTISYLLKRLEKPSPFGNPVTDEIPEETTQEDELFKLGKNAQRSARRRRFDHVHRTEEQHEAAISDMRKRVLENMRERAHNRRTL